MRIKKFSDSLNSPLNEMLVHPDYAEWEDDGKYFILSFGKYIYFIQEHDDDGLQDLLTQFPDILPDEDASSMDFHTVISFIMEVYLGTRFSLGFANTSHVTGLLTGLGLGRMRWFKEQMHSTKKA